MLDAQDAAEWLRAVVAGVTGRVPSVEDLWRALDLKQSTYYHQVRENTLLSMENIRTLARNLNINEVYLLVVCGLLDHDAVQKYCAAYEEEPRPHPLAPPKRLSDIRQPSDNVPPL